MNAVAVHAIECRGLTKSYGSLTAVGALDLEVAAGSVTGFLGPNGAGKSTVIKMLMGLARPTAGEACVLGASPGEAQARKRLGYMPADPAFYPALTGRENLDLLAALGLGGAPDREWALELLGLDDTALRRPVREYSSGMAQKLGLVQAVQHRPDLLILDEPANRLDPLAHRAFESLVRAIVSRGGTVFLSSHTLSEVQDVCDTVAMIRGGRLLAVRSVAEMSAAAPRHLRLVYDRPPGQLPGDLVDVVRHESVVTALLSAGRLDLLRELLGDPALRDVSIEPLSLEESFVELYRGNAT